MWLDKLSRQTSSTILPRERSPLSAPGRGPISDGLAACVTRTNSQDGTSLTSPSHTSLSLPRQRPNGSGLRQEYKSPQDVKDPVVVLEVLLSRSKNGSDLDAVSRAHSPEETEIEFDGLSLQEYADRDVVKAKQPLQSITVHDKPAASKLQYETLHSSITGIDNALQSVEQYLNNFRKELGQVSSEIETLQTRSGQLNTQLDNRRKVEKQLGPSVESLSVAPSVVRAIAEGPIDDDFARALTEIEARSLKVTKQDQQSTYTKAVEDVKPLLEDLKLKAVERIRDYLVAQVKALRSPNINAQIIQQQTLLNHKEFFPFLSRNHAQLAEEITQAYANTLRWYYTSNFTRYCTALDRMQLHLIDQNDLLGVDPSTRRFNTKSLVAQHDAFALGQRGSFLKSRDNRALPSHILEDTKAAHYIEVPFRNFNQALLDNLTAEYTASTELFSSNTYQQISRRVVSMFDPVFALGQTLTKRLIESTTDCIGILLCIRLNQHFAFEAQKRRLPVMDDYVNYTSILLWPKFQKAMDLHCESLRKVSTATGRGAAAAFSLIGGTDASKASVAPHAITQRFGQFLHAILTISADASDDEPVANSLSRLCGEYENLMTKLAKNAGDTTKRGQFTYNNYNLVLTIISDTHGKLAEDQKEYFSSLIRDLKPR